MTLPLAFLSLLGGFTLLVLGGEALVRAAISIAVRTKIPPSIISLTIIAAGTSAPELVTSLIAAFQGASDIAVGNVVGSNIFNILGIIGISYLLHPPKKASHSLKFEWASIVLFTGLTGYLIHDFVFSQTEGQLYTLAFVALILFSVYRSKGQLGESDEDIETLKHPLLDIFYLSIGLGFLIGGAQLALQGGIFIGEWAGLSEKVIGITIISIGTGLPELATSAVAAWRGRSDIAVGNVLGSNIMNTLAVLGLTGSLVPLTISPEIVKIDFWILLGATIVLGLNVSSWKVGRSRGLAIVFLAAYAFYLFGSIKSWAF